MAASLFNSGCSTLVEIGSDGRLDQALTTTNQVTLPVTGFAQSDYFCGPAALASLLSFEGKQVNVAELAADMVTDSREGTFRSDLTAKARREGFLALTATNRPNLLAETLQLNKPVAVLVNLSLPSIPKWHYLTVFGYDANARELKVFDGEGRELAMPVATFNRTWERASFWMVALQRPDDRPLPWVSSSQWLEETMTLSDIDKAAGKAAATVGAKQWPNDHGFPFVLGALAHNDGDLSAAARHFRQAIESRPDFAEAYYNLAWITLEQGDSAQALNLAKQGIAVAGGETHQLLEQLIVDLTAEVRP